MLLLDWWISEYFQRRKQLGYYQSIIIVTRKGFSHFCVAAGEIDTRSRSYLGDVDLRL
jgi:hypothetical protein